MGNVFDNIPNLDIFKGIKSITQSIPLEWPMSSEEFVFNEFFRKNTMLDKEAFNFKGNIEEKEIAWDEVLNVEKVEDFYLIFLKNGDVYCCKSLIRYFAKKDKVKEAFKEFREIYNESKSRC